MPAQSVSYFDALDTEVLVLDCLCGLALDGTLVHRELPQRTIPASQLRSVLLHPSVGYEARDAAMTEIVRRARSSREWQVVLLAVLAPGLKRAAKRHQSATRDLDVDIESEMVIAIIESLASGVGTRRVASSLLECANRRVRRVRRQLIREQQALASGAGDFEPIATSHGSALIESAIADGVLTPYDAELIMTTRIGERTIAELAAETGRAIGTLGRRRRRAEARLRKYVASQSIDASGMTR